MKELKPLKFPSHSDRVRAAQNARSHAMMESDADARREKFVIKFADLPIDFTVSEARFIEAFENAESMSAFWNSSTRRTCDFFMSTERGKQVRL